MWHRRRYGFRNGGTGVDVVLLRGNPSHYTVNSEGAGYRAIGPDGCDYLYAVELLSFENGATRSLDNELGDVSPAPAATSQRTPTSRVPVTHTQMPH